MDRLYYDLHIHSCLSPCANEEMTPANIVHMSMIKGLDVIAVTDHNTAKHCEAVLHWAREVGVIAIPGMELCTSEEVHVICLFKSLEGALNFDKYVEDKLMKMANNTVIFGHQELYNQEDEKIGEYPYLLINATDISFHELDHLMKQYNGIYIPAHMDKQSNSLISNLGFIPPETKFRCGELKDMEKREMMCDRYPYLNECNLISNSDAHDLANISEAVHSIEVEERTIQSIIKALGNVNSPLL